MGTLGCGKGVVADFLTQTGFTYLSLSDILREVASPLGLSHDRNSLITIGVTLRKKFGNDILARGAQQKIALSEDDFVIDSIRIPEEIKFLKKEFNAYVVGITMSPERAFSFVKERNRPGDPQTFAEYLQVCQRDLGLNEKAHGLRTGSCLELADVVLENEGSVQDLETKVGTLLIQQFEVEGRRGGKER